MSVDVALWDVFPACCRPRHSQPSKPTATKNRRSLGLGLTSNSIQPVSNLGFCSQSKLSILFFDPESQDNDHPSVSSALDGMLFTELEFQAKIKNVLNNQSTCSKLNQPTKSFLEALVLEDLEVGFGDYIDIVGYRHAGEFILGFGDASFSECVPTNLRFIPNWSECGNGLSMEFSDFSAKLWGDDYRFRIVDPERLDHFDDSYFSQENKSGTICDKMVHEVSKLKLLESQINAVPTAYRTMEDKQYKFERNEQSYTLSNWELGIYEKLITKIDMEKFPNGYVFVDYIDRVDWISKDLIECEAKKWKELKQTSLEDMIKYLREWDESKFVKEENETQAEMQQKTGYIKNQIDSLMQKFPFENNISSAREASFNFARRLSEANKQAVKQLYRDAKYGFLWEDEERSKLWEMSIWQWQQRYDEAIIARRQRVFDFVQQCALVRKYMSTDVSAMLILFVC